MAGTIQLGNNLELRPAVRSDAPALYVAIDRNRERLREWLPWVDLTRGESDVLHYLEQREPENANAEAFDAHIRVDGELCGAISLHRIEPRHRSTSIGYWLDAAYEGRGLMTQACRAMTNEGFRRYKLHRIEIRCATQNRKSSAIPQRLGYVEEGILREAEWVNDRWLDLRVFSMLEQDWNIAC